MSAFVVSTDHIDALLTFAEMKRLTARLGYYVNRGAAPLSPTDIGRVLLAENERSVNTRYKSGFAPRVDEIGYRFATFQGLFKMPHADMLALILKACDCFDYQACETDDYYQTPARDIIYAIRKAAIRALPGYDAAPWEIHLEGSAAA